MKQSFIAFILLMISSTCYGFSDTEKLSFAMQYACDSFLQEINFNSPYLEFESCSLRQSADVIPNPLTLKFRVKGEFAEQIENELYQRYQVPGFIKQQSVAGWETGRYYQLADSKYILRITFISQETQIQERDNWHEIPYFYLWFEKQEDF